MRQPNIFVFDFRFMPVFVLVLLFGLTSVFQNCAKTEFTTGQKTSTSGQGGLGTSNPGSGGSGGGSGPGGSDTNSDDDGGDFYVPPKDPEVISQNCASLAAQQRLLTHQQEIVFEDTRLHSGNSWVCDSDQNRRWEGLGNLEPYRNDYMQTRYEQVRRIQLPANAELCDLEIVMDQQRLKYDDMFYLSMNGVLLATNHGNSVSNLESTAALVGSENTGVILHRYDWSRLVGKLFSNNTQVPYCLGSSQGLSQCQWPESERSGNFLLDYNNELLINIGARAVANEHALRFVITGDNDPEIDCYHERFDFKVVAKYYIKSP